MAAHASRVGRSPSRLSPQPASTGASGRAPAPTSSAALITRPSTRRGVWCMRKLIIAALVAGPPRMPTVSTARVPQNPGTNGSTSIDSPASDIPAIATRPEGKRCTTGPAATAPTSIPTPSAVETSPMRAGSSPVVARW